MPMDI